MKQGLEKGTVMGMTPAGVRMTYIAPDEVARALALAVDEPRALGQRIDLGSDRPLSGPELAELVGHLLGRRMKVRSMGGFIGRIAAVFSPGIRGMMAMSHFFRTGKYVADTRLQAELFGPVPKIEDAARQTLTDFDLLPKETSR